MVKFNNNEVIYGGVFVKFCDTLNNRRHLQTISLFVIAIMTMASLMPFFSSNVQAATGDEVRAAKKIVSVVYDDSSSMKGKRWSYTNYSTQALIALLNQQDELYITFMSDPGNSQYVSLDSLQASVNKVRDKTKYGGTPEEALNTAMSRLESIKEKDPTTQFWYIVLTDGQIFQDKKQTTVIDIQKKFNSYKNKVMSNSSKLNIVYMGMCEAAPVTSDPANRLYSYMTNDDGAIVSAMRDISNLVSSRIVAEEVSRINGKEIRVSSKLPLYNISVLSQRSSASVEKASTDDASLNVQRNISLNATNLKLGNKLPQLDGNASVINSVSGGEQKVIPAGTYTITFSKEVDVNDIVVQFEPAIAFRTVITRNGTVVDKTEDLNYDDQISVRIIPMIPGTDEEIPSENLPKGMTCNIDYAVDDKTITSSNTSELSGVTLKEGNNSLRGTILIPGFVPYPIEKKFNIVKPAPTPPPVYHFGIVVEEPDVYVPADMKPEKFTVSGVTYDRSALKKIKFDQSNTVKFQITNDGKPLNAERQTELGVSLELVGLDYESAKEKGRWNFLGSKLMRCHLEKNTDGSYSLIPEVPAFFWFMSFLIKDGTYTANVKVNRDGLNETISNTGHFVLIRNKSEDKFPWIILIILLILLYMILCSTKKKFKNQLVSFEKFVLQSNGKGIQDHSFTISKRLTNNLLFTLFVPYKASVRTWNGFTFIADSEGQIIVTGKSIAHKYKYSGNRNQNPENKLGQISKSLNPTKNKKKECVVSDTYLQPNSPIYFENVNPKVDKDYKGDVYVYRLNYKK